MTDRLPIDWHPVEAIPFVVPATSRQITQRPCRLYGLGVTETTGQAGAAVQLIDGGDANGSLVTDISLVPSESTRDWYGQPGIRVRSGLFLSVLSGTVRGVVWALLLTEDEILKMALGD